MLLPACVAIAGPATSVAIAVLAGSGEGCSVAFAEVLQK
jgi:hypothetical protein